MSVKDLRILVQYLFQSGRRVLTLRLYVMLCFPSMRNKKILTFTHVLNDHFINILHVAGKNNPNFLSHRMILNGLHSNVTLMSKQILL